MLSVLPAVETEKENIEFWTKKIFRPCRRKKQFVMFCHNLLSLVPGNGDVSWLQRLLNDHPDDLMDEVACQAEEVNHQQEYNDCVNKTLEDEFGTRGSGKSTKPSGKRNFIMLHYRPFSSSEGGTIRPDTRFPQSKFSAFLVLLF